MSLMKNKNVFSWSIQNNLSAIKKVDKSFYTYGETVIPIEIRNFFKLENYKNGDKIDISIIFNNKEYKGDIIFENNFNRSKLKFRSDLMKIVQATIDKSTCSGNYDNINAIFIKDISNRYYMSLSIEL
ncbi:hypothetical protein DVW12_08920 [Clostridium botulinum]|uniref:hypothetical protein n=1 Tax=Clostridium sp. ZS6 TaxID=2949987 RepID=UPI0013F9F486|nr:hypothetical protein [Clostridium sp. ZS6]MBN1038827.1 hypothetical protein [Clostridium botulinum]NFI57509.1 hypothetical protein [Clostridium botulinum]